MKLIASALAVILSLTTGAFAEGFTPTEMSQGLDMLQLQLQNMIVVYGIDVNVDNFTLAQVAEIISAVQNGADTKDEIERAIDVALAR
jgi:hypothetical protein